MVGGERGRRRKEEQGEVRRIRAKQSKGGTERERELKREVERELDTKLETELDTELETELDTGLGT